MNYRTSINPTKSIYQPADGQRRLSQDAPLKFQSPAATQHAQDVYRGQGQAAAVNMGRNATQAQNQYYQAAQRAQNDSVLGGLANLSQEVSNRYAEAQAADQIRYRFLNDVIGNAFGALGGLM